MRRIRTMTVAQRGRLSAEDNTMASEVNVLVERRSYP
jgi:hypothetical protein